jgi:hypothetical protein
MSLDVAPLSILQQAICGHESVTIILRMHFSCVRAQTPCPARLPTLSPVPPGANPSISLFVQMQKYKIAKIQVPPKMKNVGGRVVSFFHKKSGFFMSADSFFLGSKVKKQYG